MKVADLMSKRAVCVRLNEPLSVAVQQMWDNDCGSLPVLDNEGQRAVGMVTDRDICMTTWKRGRPMHEITVAEATSRILYFCAPDDSIASAEALMREKQVRRLPVIDRDGHVVGIISLADIAREVDRERARRDREIVPDELAAVIAAICQPPQNTTVRPA